jgi:hypothetical protein
VIGPEPNFLNRPAFLPGGIPDHWALLKKSPHGPMCPWNKSSNGAGHADMKIGKVYRYGFPTPLPPGIKFRACGSTYQPVLYSRILPACEWRRI